MAGNDKTLYEDLKSALSGETKNYKFATTRIREASKEALLKIDPLSNEPPAAIAADAGTVEHIRLCIEKNIDFTAKLPNNSTFLDIVVKADARDNNNAARTKVLFEEGGVKPDSAAANHCLANLIGGLGSLAKILGLPGKGSEDVAVVFLENGVNPNGKVLDIMPYLLMAMNDNKFDLVKVLIKNNADVNIKFKDGSTPLHSAAYHHSEYICELLLRNNPEVNAVDSEHRTPLHIAASMGKEAFCKLLVNMGADLLAEDNLGNTPSDLAADQGYEALAKVLAPRKSSSPTP